MSDKAYDPDAFCQVHDRLPHPCPWCRIDELEAEKSRLHDESDREHARAVELADWVAGADHHPGCSGGYSSEFRCKCGLRELLGDE